MLTCRHIVVCWIVERGRFRVHPMIIWQSLARQKQVDGERSKGPGLLDLLNIAISRFLLSSWLLLGLGSYVVSVAAPPVAKVWQLHEITLTAENRYENPYTEVDVWVDLRGPGFVERVWYDWPGSFTRSVRYLAARYGAHNLVFSGVHYDWYHPVHSLSGEAFSEALTHYLREYGPLPFGQPFTALVAGSSLEQFGHGELAPWLVMHGAGNEYREHRIVRQLEDIFRLDPPYPAINTKAKGGQRLCPQSLDAADQVVDFREQACGLRLGSDGDSGGVWCVPSHPIAEEDVPTGKGPYQRGHRSPPIDPHTGGVAVTDVKAESTQFGGDCSTRFSRHRP